jgi:hypothetical protein
VAEPFGITTVPAPLTALKVRLCAEVSVKSVPAVAVLEASSWKFTLISPVLLVRVKAYSPVVLPSTAVATVAAMLTPGLMVRLKVLLAVELLVSVTVTV